MRVPRSLVADPTSSVNTARTFQPFSKVLKITPLNVSEVDLLVT